MQRYKLELLFCTLSIKIQSHIDINLFCDIIEITDQGRETKEYIKILGSEVLIV